MQTEHQEVRFFDGSYALPSYRGRTSKCVKYPDRWAAMAFALVVMCSTAAGAVVVRHIVEGRGDYSVAAAPGPSQFGSGFAELLW